MNERRHWLPRLLTVFTVGALAVFLLMLTHKSTSLWLLGRFSVVTGGVLVSLLFAGGAAFVGSYWLRTRPAVLDNFDRRLMAWRNRTIWTGLILGLCVALTGLLWLPFTGDMFVAHQVLLSFLVVSINGLGLALVFAGSEPPKSGGWRFVFVGAALGLAGVALLITDFRPALQQADEAFFASEIKSALNTAGRSTQPLIDRYAWENDVHAGLWIHVALPYFEVAGLSLRSARVFFLVVGFACTGCLFVALRQLYEPTLAWIAALLALYALSAANIIRPEMPSALFLSAALYFYSLAEKRPAWHFAVGLAVAMCIDSSPATYAFGLGFGLLYLVQYVNQVHTQRNWRWSPFWLLVAGQLIVVTYFLLTRSGPIFTSLVPLGSIRAGQQTTAQLGAQYVTLLGQRVLSSASFDIARQWLYGCFTSQPLLSSLAVFGIGAALWRRTRADQLLLAAFGSWAGVIVLTYPFFTNYDVLPAIPLLAALAASGIVFGLNLSLRLKLAEHPPMIRAVGLLVGACLLFATVHDVRSAALPGQSLNDVVNVARQINQIVPPNWVLVADEPFYFGLLDHPHFASADLNLLMVATGQYTGTQAWDTIAPDALVFSAARPPAHTTELDRYIQARQIVFTACWQTASYGRIELWMRDPPAPTSPDTNRCPFMPN